MMKVITETENLSLIDALELETKARVVLKAHDRIGLPHKIIQVGEECTFITNQNRFYSLNVGDCVAAYKTPNSDRCSGAYYVVPLSEREMMKIDELLNRRFNSSLAKEKASNLSPIVSSLPFLTVAINTVKGLSLKAKELYSSDGKSSTRLISILKLTENISFWVQDREKRNKRHLYRARLGDIFCVLNEIEGKKAKLVLVSKSDVPAIKMQEKKEKILRASKRKNISTQNVLRIIRRRKIEKIRN